MKVEKTVSLGYFYQKIKINLVEMLPICPSANPPLRKSVSWNCNVLGLATWEHACEVGGNDS